MAKPTIMSYIQIQLLLLLSMSISAAVLIYWGYLSYERNRHLTHIKNLISHNEYAELELLEAKAKEKTRSFKHKLEAKMKLAGLKFPVAIFILLCLIFISIFGLLLFTFLQHWSGFLIGSTLGILIFYMILQSIILSRKKEFNRALATSISVLVKMMKNGIGFEQAMFKSISVSNSNMFKEIFESYFTEKNTAGEEEAFASLNQWVDSKELLIFALAVKIGRASGGRFSNTLEKVETTIAYRKKMQNKVDVVTRESAVGSYMVAAIAVFLYFALNLNFDGKLHEYYMTSEYGRFQLLGIGTWVFFGLIVNKLITKVEK